MGAPLNNGGGDAQPLAEINVTPFVDVMLVLLIIFMVASSVDTVRVEQELEEIRRERQEAIEEELLQHPSQKVPIDLPKVNAEQVNLAEEQKLVLTMTMNHEFFIGDTRVIRCAEAATKAKPSGDAPPAAGPELDDATFRSCLVQLEDKLLENEKLKVDKELYLRADRSIEYGRVLMTMARIRKAGVTKFGLVAEPDLEQ